MGQCLRFSDYCQHAAGYGSAGPMKDRKDYGAFGDETATAARVSALGYTTAEPTRKGYTGYEKDAESSLEFP